MNATILKLIVLVNKITIPEKYVQRDIHYEITLSYNEGQPMWYLAHDGAVWKMEQYLPPSQNGFTTFKVAEKALERVLLDAARDGIVRGRDAGRNMDELEIQYLSAEISH